MGLRGAFAKWTREGNVSKWQEYNAHFLNYFCESPAPRKVVGQAWSMVHGIEQGLTNFFYKGLKVNIFSFPAYIVSVTTTELLGQKQPQTICK